MAVVLYLPAIVLVAITGIEVLPAVLIMGLLCTVYTVAGGMDAVIWTEVVEAVTLLAGVLVCLAVVLFRLDGGVQEFVSVAQTHDKLRLANWGWDAASATVGVVLIGNIFTRLSNLTSDQSCVQRYLTTSDARTAKLALWTDVAFSIPWAILVFSLGTAIFVFYQAHPEKLHPAVQTDGIVPFFISRQLPVGIAGLVVSAIMVSAMSSMESSMHAIATLCVTDFYGRFRPGASDKLRLKVARVITLLLGLFGTGAAMLLATSNVLSLWDLFQYLMGLFVGSLAGLFMLGIFIRRGPTARARGLGRWRVLGCWLSFPTAAGFIS
jgi:Na+/proline symporter